MVDYLVKNQKGTNVQNPAEHFAS